MINRYKPQFTILQQEILRYLFIKTGKSFNARALGKALDRTQAGIAKALPELEKEDLIKISKDKDSGRWSIELNRDNQKAVDFKRAENLKMIYESGIVQFLENKFPGSTIILFGSYSYGEDTFNSDIDIAIIDSKEKHLDLKEFDKLLERNVFLHFYNSLEKVDKNLRSNILRGITLIGVSEI